MARNIFDEVLDLELDSEEGLPHESDIVDPAWDDFMETEVFVDHRNQGVLDLSYGG